MSSKRKFYTSIAFIFLSILLLWSVSHAQVIKRLTIEQCYVLAKDNYPLAKQKELIRRSWDYSVENVTKNYLPQVNINGQATYQSDVTKIPIKIPGMEIPTVSKGQYKIYGEVNQTLYDGGLAKQQIKTQELNAHVEQQKLETELYMLKERINQLVFGILLIDEQLKQSALVKNDIELGITKTNAAITNGTAIKSNADVLKAELLKANQRVIELAANRKAFLDMLSLFINQPLDENTSLEKPVPATIFQEIRRPELLVYDYQKKSLDIQNKIIDMKRLPKIVLFLQAGAGRPSLINFLNNKFSGFYIGGIRFSWPLSAFYTSENEKLLLDIDRKSLDIQKETFLLNTNITLQQQSGEISKWQDLVQSDDDIIALRNKIKNTASVQLENGLINSNDYLREVNAEDAARLNQVVHKLQLLMAQYNYKTTSGN